MQNHQPPPQHRRTSPGATTLAALFGSALTALASSHSDAPLIKQDPQANLTDLYAFVGTNVNDPSEEVLNVIVSVRPFSDPGDGLIYERFADDALYSIHITDPATGEEKTRYDFRFSDTNPTRGFGLKNPDTILSYGLGTEVGPIEETGDARQNYTQYYYVFKDRRYVAAGLVAPPNVGGNTTPNYNDANGSAVSGAADLGSLDSYTAENINDMRKGSGKVWAGPREDGFYADTPGIFDLLNVRILDNNGSLADGLGQDGGGVDGFKGFNVLSYAIQIPLSELEPQPYTAAFADLSEPLPAVAESTGVGVYASVSRRRITLRSDRRENRDFGSWVQVNRLGNPLFNEVLVPLKDKDKYNRTSPEDDVANFADYALNPEVAALINTVYGTTFATTGRGDVQLVFLPDVLRVDTTTGPVSLPGDAAFSRFGFAGGDTATNGAGRIVSSGWPNGRRPGDDVVDIALTAVASGPGYGTVTVVGDNADANDQLYNQVFPYLGTPHAGTTTNQRQAP